MSIDFNCLRMVVGLSIVFLVGCDLGAKSTSSVDEQAPTDPVVEEEKTAAEKTVPGEEAGEPAAEVTQSGVLAVGSPMIGELQTDLVAAGLTQAQAEAITSGAENELVTASTLAVDTGAGLRLTQATSSPIRIAAPALVRGAIMALDDASAALNDVTSRAEICSVIMDSLFKGLNGRMTDLDDAGVESLTSAMVGDAVTSLSEGGIPAANTDVGTNAITKGAVRALKKAGIPKEKTISFAKVVLTSTIRKLKDLALSSEEISNAVGTATEGAVASVTANDLSASEGAGAAGDLAEASVNSLADLAIAKAVVVATVKKVSQRAVAALDEAAVGGSDLSTAIENITSKSVKALRQGAGLAETADLKEAAGAIAAGAVEGIKDAGVAEQDVADSGIMETVMSGTISSLGDAGLDQEEIADAVGVITDKAVESISRTNLSDDSQKKRAISRVIKGTMASVSRAGVADETLRKVAIGNVTKNATAAIVRAGIQGKDAISDVAAEISKTAIANVREAGINNSADLEEITGTIAKASVEAYSAFKDQGLINAEELKADTEKLTNGVIAGFAEIDTTENFTGAVDIAQLATNATSSSLEGLVVKGAVSASDIDALQEDLIRGAKDSLSDSGSLTEAELDAFEQQAQLETQEKVDLAVSVEDDAFARCATAYPSTLTDAEFLQAITAESGDVLCKKPVEARCPEPRTFDDYVYRFEGEPGVVLCSLEVFEKPTNPVSPRPPAQQSTPETATTPTGKPDYPSRNPPVAAQEMGSGNADGEVKDIDQVTGDPGGREPISGSEDRKVRLHWGDDPDAEEGSTKQFHISLDGPNETGTEILFEVTTELDASEYSFGPSEVEVYSHGDGQYSVFMEQERYDLDLAVGFVDNEILRNLSEDFTVTLVKNDATEYTTEAGSDQFTFFVLDEEHQFICDGTGSPDSCTIAAFAPNEPLFLKKIAVDSLEINGNILWTGGISLEPLEIVTEDFVLGESARLVVDHLKIVVGNAATISGEIIAGGGQATQLVSGGGEGGTHVGMGGKSSSSDSLLPNATLELSFTNPTPGSDGSGNVYPAGAGGGTIWLEVAHQVQINGRISADGGDAEVMGGSGGGAGGWISVNAEKIAGEGSITANGGRGGMDVNQTQDSRGGGGGGGLIRVTGHMGNPDDTAAQRWQGVVAARGGEAGGIDAEKGGMGAVCFRDLAILSAPEDFDCYTLAFENSGAVSGRAASHLYGISNLTILDELLVQGVTLYVDAETQIDAPSGDVHLTAGAKLVNSHYIPFDGDRYSGNADLGFEVSDAQKEQEPEIGGVLSIHSNNLLLDANTKIESSLDLEIENNLVIAGDRGLDASGKGFRGGEIGQDGLGVPNYGASQGYDVLYGNANLKSPFQVENFPLLPGGGGAGGSCGSGGFGGGTIRIKAQKLVLNSHNGIYADGGIGTADQDCLSEGGSAGSGGAGGSVFLDVKTVSVGNAVSSPMINAQGGPSEGGGPSGGSSGVGGRVYLNFTWDENMEYQPYLMIRNASGLGSSYGFCYASPASPTNLCPSP